MSNVLTEQQWRSLYELVEQGIDLEGADQARWLDQLDVRHAALKPLLAKALARAASDEPGGFLATLPKLGAAYARADAVTAAGLAAGQRIGPYHLIRELGRGGMGSVWLAERGDGLVSRRVALKLPHAPTHRPELAERFAREREILATLSHPNIARLYDVGLSAGQPYLAMECVEGRPLTEYCDTRGLGLRERILLFMQALAVVQYAHERLVVHRDLKPSNMLVTSAGEVRLLDFGIAKLLVEGEARETELTQLGGRALTLSYASPEQVAGQPIGTASDVYSLGVVLYELLTGVLPYRLARHSRGALEEAILNADPPRPSQAVGDVPAVSGTTRARLARSLDGDLDTIVGKTLKKAPAERYGTAQALAGDLQRYLDGRPVLARPDTMWYRTSKFVARNRLLVGAAVAVVAAALMLVLTATAATVAALIVGLAVALWQARRASQHARTAEQEARRAMAETRTAHSVQAFLQDIFRASSSAQADPVKARQTTARELLDIGSGRIDTALEEAPEAKVEVLATLARLYKDLGVSEQELALSARRVTLVRSLYGPRDPRLAEALVDQALALYFAEGTLPLLEEARAILDANHDATSTTRGRLLSAFAAFYSSRGPARALEFAEQAVRILRKGPLSMHLQRALVALGDQYAHLSHHDMAEKLLLEAVDVANALRPESNDLIPDLYSILGRCQERAQKFSAAEKSFRFSRDEAIRVYDAGDIAVVVAEFRLAALLCRSEPAAGIAGLERASQRMAALAHTDHNRRLLVFRGGIRPLLNFGRLEQAEARAVECVKGYREHFGGSFPLAISLDLLAAVAAEMGRYDEALAALEEAEDLHARTNTAGDLRIEHQVTLARLRSVTKHFDEAERALAALSEPAPDLARLPQGWVEREIGRSALELARERPEQAIEHAARARVAIADHDLRPYFIVWETRSTMLEGAARLAAGRAGEALPLLQRALELGQRVYDPEESPELAEIRGALARCLVDLGRVVEAQPLVESARAIHAAHVSLGAHYTASLRAIEIRLGASVAA